MSYIQAGASGGGGGRTISKANANYYVATTGSDSNPGTLASPWATLNHAAIVFSSSIDFAGFLVTVNIGAGSFAGVDLLSTVGGGWLNFIGAGSGSTTITVSPVAIGCFSFNSTGITANVGFDSMTVDATGLGSGGGLIYMGFPGATCNIGNAFTFVCDDVILTATAGLAIITIIAQAIVYVDIMGANNIRVSGSWVNAFNIFGEGLLSDFGQWTMVGTPTFSSAFAMVSDAQYTYNSATANYFGSATGQRFLVEKNGTIDVNDSAGTFFPGNTVGQILSGGQYGGITDFIGIVASLPSANIQGARCFVTDALAATFGSAPTGGHATFVPVYNNSSGWIMG